LFLPLIPSVTFAAVFFLFFFSVCNYNNVFLLYLKFSAFIFVSALAYLYYMLVSYCLVIHAIIYFVGPCPTWICIDILEVDCWMCYWPCWELEIMPFFYSFVSSIELINQDGFYLALDSPKKKHWVDNRDSLSHHWYYSIISSSNM